MAKLAVINREAKRRATVKKYAEKRQALLAMLQDPKATDDAKDQARAKLQALPRVRDFRGVSGRAFDSRGNYNMGIKEQIIFPEIEYDKIDTLRGLNISITTTAKTDEEAKALLAAFRFPFRTERT